METHLQQEQSVQRRGFLAVLSGPSSAGKSTLLNTILHKIPRLCYSISATTRPPRPGERDGEDYFFLNVETFKHMAATGELLEWAEYCGNLYGTPRQYVEESMAQGKIVITDINIAGARQIRDTMPEGVFIFLMPPSLGELRKRIVNRGVDTEESMRMRMAEAVAEMSAVTDYDYCILNDNLNEAATNLIAILQAERCRVRRTVLHMLGQ